VSTPFDWILVMCALAGLLMVIGSIALLYNGAIQLSEKNPGQAIEAEFKNQLKVNVRNPALGLFVIWFAFFVLPLYVARPESDPPLAIRGHIKIADVEGIAVRLTFVEPQIGVSSEGEIDTIVQPVQNLWITIVPPTGYLPERWSHQIKSDEVKLKHGQIDINPEFRRAPDTGLVKRKLEIPSKPMLPFK
jgi:hypothetical protein